MDNTDAPFRPQRSTNLQSIYTLNLLKKTTNKIMTIMTTNLRMRINVSLKGRWFLNSQAPHFDNRGERSFVTRWAARQRETKTTGQTMFVDSMLQ